MLKTLLGFHIKVNARSIHLPRSDATYQVTFYINSNGLCHFVLYLYTKHGNLIKQWEADSEMRSKNNEGNFVFMLYEGKLYCHDYIPTHEKLSI